MKENSILTPGVVANIVWTMNRDQVTAYTESGVKVFSKDPGDEQLIQLNESFQLEDHYCKVQNKTSSLPLKGTYMATIDKYLNIYY